MFQENLSSDVATSGIKVWGVEVDGSKVAKSPGEARVAVPEQVLPPGHLHKGEERERMRGVGLPRLQEPRWMGDSVQSNVQIESCCPTRLRMSAVGGRRATSPMSLFALGSLFPA